MAQKDARHSNLMVNMLPRLDSLSLLRILVPKYLTNTMESNLDNMFTITF